MGNDNLIINDIDDVAAPLAATAAPIGQGFFQTLPVDVTLEVCSTEMTLAELSRLGHGDVVQLNARVGDPIDIKVNGQLLGRGEVVDVEGRYGVRLIEVFAQQ
ncbi:FliM/FliN family flagellar motor switch protein [uncultured Ferrimonas sp.]|uniref:FliM/FliN family flagellar motor switch protein n=1 Tax=uncultured Ferrimonas sp. TaxID=432640 RepID=UPI002626002F|nr:FliM/FliN family flagellar motor switch protein [uncultured Ferrimonas sp.]